jgi:hypothetical protein
VTSEDNSPLKTASGSKRINMLLDEMSSANMPGGSTGATSVVQQAELHWHLSQATASNSPIPSALTLRFVAHTSNTFSPEVNMRTSLIDTSWNFQTPSELCCGRQVLCRKRCIWFQVSSLKF